MNWLSIFYYKLKIITVSRKNVLFSVLVVTYQPIKLSKTSNHTRFYTMAEKNYSQGQYCYKGLFIINRKHFHDTAKNYWPDILLSLQNLIVMVSINNFTTRFFTCRRARTALAE